MSVTRARTNYSLLTRQEKKVLKQLVKAQTNKEIAASLEISPSTVKRHLENILKKLRLRNRVDAAVYAVRAGELPFRCERDEEGILDGPFGQ